MGLHGCTRSSRLSLFTYGIRAFFPSVHYILGDRIHSIDFHAFLLQARQFL